MENVVEGVSCPCLWSDKTNSCSSSTESQQVTVVIWDLFCPKMLCKKVFLTPHRCQPPEPRRDKPQWEKLPQTSRYLLPLLSLHSLDEESLLFLSQKHRDPYNPPVSGLGWTGGQKKKHFRSAHSATLASGTSGQGANPGARV